MKAILRYIIPLLIKILPETSFFKIKIILLKIIGIKFGKNVRICSSARIFPIGEIIIGDNVWIGPEAIISSNKGSRIVIEDYVRIGMRVIIVTGFHEITPNGNSIEGEGTSSQIHIKKGSAISTMSIILPGITINEMSHVAAGSVVTKDVNSYTRVAGVPAKEIKKFC